MGNLRKNQKSKDKTFTVPQLVPPPVATLERQATRKKQADWLVG